MRKSFFSAALAVLVGVLFGFFTPVAQAAPNSPANIKALDQLIASSRDGKTARQGDLILNVARLRAYRDKLKGKSSKGAFLRTTYWTGGRVPYVFDPTLDADSQASFIFAAREWEKYANLKFFPRTTEANFIRVFWDGQSTGVAYSYLGMVGGSQQMMLGKGVGPWVTAHEIGHAMGMIHEHCRSDRDTFITVQFGNVAPGLESQYAITSDSDNHRGYDFDSIMHYFDTAFSVDGTKKTMICKPGYEAFQGLMGQQSHLSVNDKLAMSDIYGFPPGAQPTPTPTLPPRPTIVADDVSIKEGDTGTTAMTFRVLLSSLPTKDVSFFYKIQRFIPPGMTADSPASDLDKYSAKPGEDFSVQLLEGSFTLPAATTDNNGNSTKEADITVSINGDMKIENDETLLLVLSDPVNARFANEAATTSIKGTILNDDFDTSPTPTPGPLPTEAPAPTATPSATATPSPTGTPRPTPVLLPVARVTISPSSPSKTDTVVAHVVLTPTSGTTATLVWRLNSTIVARNVYSLNLANVRSAKRGDTITVEVTPVRAGVKGKPVTARVEVGNTAPTAREASATTRSAVPVSVALSGSDPDGDTLTFALSARPRNGTASISQEEGRSILHYRSKVGFIGTESLSVVALDASAKSLAATVQITVNANTSPQLGSVTPSSGSFPTPTAISFVQTVSDPEKNIETVKFLVGNSSRSADVRNGVSLVYDATTRTIQMQSSDGATLSEPVTIGGTLENERAKAVLRRISTTDSGELKLGWQITFKAGFTGEKTLWSRVEDAGTLYAGFKSMGKITLSGSGSGGTRSSAGGS